VIGRPDSVTAPPLDTGISYSYGANAVMRNPWAADFARTPFGMAGLAVIPLHAGAQAPSNVSRGRAVDSVSALIDSTVRRIMGQRDIPVLP
jgi:hypothetical protein